LIIYSGIKKGLLRLNSTLFLKTSSTLLLRFRRRVENRSTHISFIQSLGRRAFFLLRKASQLLNLGINLIALIVAKAIAKTKQTFNLLNPLLSPVTVRAKRFYIPVAKIKTELLIILILIIGVGFSQAGFFTDKLISSANSSDAFRLINRFGHLNQKLADVARLSETDDSIMPKILAFASAAGEIVSREESKNSESSILTTAGDSALVKPNYTVATPLEGNLAIYRVAEGDNPTIIASRYGVGLPTLLRANNLNDASMIKPGQELKVPLCDGLLYNMKSTDTLESIMSTYKLQEADIDYLLNCNDVENFEDLHNIGLALIPQSDLSIPKAPILVRSITSNTAGRVALTTARSSGTITGGTGNMLWPIPNSRTITQRFTGRHNGIDVSCNKQAVGINAADGGFVEIAGWQVGGWGNTVVIDHGNDTKTRYAHLSTIGVTAGDTVVRGQNLGKCGSTGRSTGPHLHFTIYINGRALNPLSYLAN